MPEAPLLLAFDTSAAHCAAVLLSGDAVLAEAREDMARGQAERLVPLLDETLAAGGATWRDLARIGVGIGPGNFTGIRISVATARGLALGLSIPAIGVTSLEALAHGTPGPVVTSVDARGDKLYLSDGGAPMVASLDTLPALPRGATCIGHEADAVARACGGHAAASAFGIAGAVARVAMVRPAGGRPAPAYVRAPDAAPARPVPPVA